MVANATQLWRDIQDKISDHLQRAIKIQRVIPVTGGDISKSFLLHCLTERFFVKVNKLELAALFTAEAHALAEISNNIPDACPNVICAGSNADNSYLVLQYLDLSTRSNAAEGVLGELIARLHNIENNTAPHSLQYGWMEDNFIGLTPQKNTWTASWCEFFIEQRLKPQTLLARQNGFDRQFRSISSELMSAVESLLKLYQPTPSLLHGDLWSGNAAIDNQGRGRIYDPATYYGDAECDIAMTELFGGFGSQFYEAYYQLRPQKSDYLQRKTIYNLYHMLNHLNLFGSGYLAQVQRYIKLIMSYVD